MSKIAIIMSVYENDTLSYLQEALESLYCQTLKVDVFIQQDGRLSSELYSYLKHEFKKKRILYLGERDGNRGLAYSLNELLERVLPDYTYIARMDADDISMPQRIAVQYKFMQANPKIDIVGGYIEEFSDDMMYQKIVKYPLYHDEMFDFFSKRVPLAHVTAMYHRRFFEKAGQYPTSSLTNEDTLMWMQGFWHGCLFANIPEILVRVRVSQNFFSRRGGLAKAWSDLKDRVLVIRTLGYNNFSYIYAMALFIVNIAPGRIKQFLYVRLR
jgi:glycosyltransferase involved in cell wall biosynthesis